ALSYKAKDQSLFVIEDFELSSPKTKDYINILSALKLNDKKSMLIVNAGQDNIFKSARNLKNANVVTSSDVNTYNLMNANAVMLTESVVNILNETLK
ncbi:MAG: 50S ribosomal protein L4, partial [Flavobacterium sp.]